MVLLTFLVLAAATWAIALALHQTFLAGVLMVLLTFLVLAAATWAFLVLAAATWAIALALHQTFLGGPDPPRRRSRVRRARCPLVPCAAVARPAGSGRATRGSSPTTFSEPRSCA